MATGTSESRAGAQATTRATAPPNVGVRVMAGDLPTRPQRDAYARVAAIHDPIGECAMRWPYFRMTVRKVQESDGRLYTHVEAAWTRAGEKHGLRDRLLGEASSDEIHNSERNIALSALLTDEQRNDRAQNVTG